MSMEGLRQGAQNIGSGKGKGSSRSSFYVRWKPPAMNDTLKRFLAAPPAEESYLGVAEPIVLIKGQYPDLYSRNPDGSAPNPPPITEAHRYRSHTFPIFVQPKKAGQQGFKSFREIVCSAGPEPHAPQPCVGCHQVDHGADSKARDQWAFNIAHLGWYHSHPLMKDGQPQLRKNAKNQNDYIMIKDECLSYKMENTLLGRAAQSRTQGLRQPKQCEGCGGNHPYVFGDHRILQIGLGHLKDLFAVDEEIGKKCTNCGTYVIPFEFQCGNDACRSLITTIADSRMTNDQIDQFSKSYYDCTTCRQTFVPQLRYRCGFDDKFSPVMGGCASGIDAQRMSIFDCVLWIQREGERMESKLVVKKVVPIGQFQTQDGRSLYEHLPEIVKEPFDLAEMYAPDSPDEQAKVLNIVNPYVPQQPAWQPYGAPGPMGQAPTGFNQPGMPQQPQQQSPMYPNMPVPGRPNYGK